MGKYSARNLGRMAGASIAKKFGGGTNAQSTIGNITGMAGKYASDTAHTAIAAMPYGNIALKGYNYVKKLAGYEKGGLKAYGGRVIVVDPYTNKNGTYVKRTYRNKKTNNPKLGIGEMRQMMKPFRATIKRVFNDSQQLKHKERWAAYSAKQRQHKRFK